MLLRIAIAALSLAAFAAEQRRTDPTFLRRHVPALKEKPAAVTTPTCHYKPVFGEGDADAKILRGIARFAEITVDPGGACEPASFAREEQALVVLDGSGVLDYAGEKHPLRKNDFFYLPPGIKHGLANPAKEPCRVVVMGFRIPANVTAAPPPKLLVANIDDVPKQVVGGHPPSTLYQLLMGDVKSTRDRLAAGHVLTSLFTMEFDAGGTNFPHHHEREEEIYLVLNGHGDMVAGGGMDG
ncbi:MAG: cupin domain-containing protein, partial [Acidobacteriota bacterium]